MIGIAALVIASLFTGAAFYINFAEHPARMALPMAQARAQWAPAYKRGYMMQGSLAVLGGLCGALVWWRWGVPFHLAGAVLMFANWPWTLFAIMPVNRRLLAMKGDENGPETDMLLRRWNLLHAGRTALGALATACYAIALLRSI